MKAIFAGFDSTVSCILQEAGLETHDGPLPIATKETFHVMVLEHNFLSHGICGNAFAKQLVFLSRLFSSSEFLISPPPSEWLEEIWNGTELHCISAAGSPDAVLQEIPALTRRIPENGIAGEMLLACLIITASISVLQVNDLIRTMTDKFPQYKIHILHGQDNDNISNLEIHLVYGNRTTEPAGGSRIYLYRPEMPTMDFSE